VPPFERGVHLVDRRALLDFGGQVDDRHVGVGTRSETPSNLPFTSGSTRPVAFAAPVVVGMMLRAAARARRRSLLWQIEDLLVVRVTVQGVELVLESTGALHRRDRRAKHLTPGQRRS